MVRLLQSPQQQHKGRATGSAMCQTCGKFILNIRLRSFPAYACMFQIIIVSNEQRYTKRQHWHTVERCRSLIISQWNRAKHFLAFFSVSVVFITRSERSSKKPCVAMALAARRRENSPHRGEFSIASRPPHTHSQYRAAQSLSQLLSYRATRCSVFMGRSKDSVQRRVQIVARFLKLNYFLCYPFTLIDLNKRHKWKRTQ